MAGLLPRACGLMALLFPSGEPRLRPHLHAPGSGSGTETTAGSRNWNGNRRAGRGAPGPPVGQREGEPREHLARAAGLLPVAAQLGEDLTARRGLQGRRDHRGFSWYRQSKLFFFSACICMILMCSTLWFVLKRCGPDCS